MRDEHESLRPCALPAPLEADRACLHVHVVLSPCVNAACVLPRVLAGGGYGCIDLRLSFFGGAAKYASPVAINCVGIGPPPPSPPPPPAAPEPARPLPPSPPTTPQSPPPAPPDPSPPPPSPWPVRPPMPPGVPMFIPRVIGRWRSPPPPQIPSISPPPPPSPSPPPPLSAQHASILPPSPDEALRASSSTLLQSAALKVGAGADEDAAGLQALQTIALPAALVVMALGCVTCWLLRSHRTYTQASADESEESEDEEEDEEDSGHDIMREKASIQKAIKERMQARSQQLHSQAEKMRVCGSASAQSKPPLSSPRTTAEVARPAFHHDLE